VRSWNTHDDNNPIDGKSGSIEALQLRHVVFGADDALDRSSMRISERVAVVGSEEVMRDSLVAEAIDTEEVPHPLAVSKETGMEVD